MLLILSIVSDAAMPIRKASFMRGFLHYIKTLHYTMSSSEGLRIARYPLLSFLLCYRGFLHMCPCTQGTARTENTSDTSRLGVGALAPCFHSLFFSLENAYG